MKKKTSLVCYLVLLTILLWILVDQDEHRVGMWSLDLEGNAQRIGNLGPASCVAISPDQTQIAAGKEGRVDVYTIDGIQIKSIANVKGDCIEIYWSQNGIIGKIRESSSNSHWARFDLEQEKSQVLSVPEETETFSPDGQFVLTRPYIDSQKVAIWDVAQKREIVIGDAAAEFASAWSPDSKKVAFVDSTTGLTIANTTGEVQPVLPKRQVLPLQWSPDQRYLLARSGDDLVIIEMETGVEVMHLEGTNTLIDAEWAQDSKRLLYTDAVRDGLGIALHEVDLSGQSRLIAQLEQSTLYFKWFKADTSILFFALE